MAELSHQMLVISVRCSKLTTNHQHSEQSFLKSVFYYLVLLYTQSGGWWGKVQVEPGKVLCSCSVSLLLLGFNKKLWGALTYFENYWEKKTWIKHVLATRTILFVMMFLLTKSSTQHLTKWFDQCCFCPCACADCPKKWSFLAFDLVHEWKYLIYSCF